MLALYLASRPTKVYLVDFSCYKPPPALKTSKTACMQRILQSDSFSEESIEFQKKIFERSGIGEEAYLPDSLTRIPPKRTLSEARKEAEMLMFGAIDGVLEKRGVNPKNIRILVVNCSLFNPPPSLTSVAVNRYKLRENVKSYSLAGMGCSAGPISVDLAQQLLQVGVLSNLCLLQMYGSNNNICTCRNNLINYAVFAKGGLIS